jgi:magnesium transporter
MLEIPELRDKLLVAAENDDVDTIRQLAKVAQQVDFAEVLEELDDRLILRVFRMLQQEEATEIFSYLDPEIQEYLLGSFTTLEIKEIVDDLYSDDLVDVIDEMPAKIVTKILKSTSAERRAEINNILKFEEKSAGAMMSVNFVEIRETDTVAKTIKTIRSIHTDMETIDVLFVIDQYGHLKGTFEFKDLIFNDPKTKIQNIMNPRLLFVESDADQEAVTAVFKRYDVNSLPVVDKTGKVLGIITVDDVIDVIDEEATEDMTKLAGINNLKNEYFDVNI